MSNTSDQSVRTLQPAQRRHLDGTRCLEGTRKLPRNFAPCCSEFERHTAACTHDVRYEWSDSLQSWCIALSAASGAGGQNIRYCPHCGTSLMSKPAASS